MCFTLMRKYMLENGFVLCYNRLQLIMEYEILLQNQRTVVIQSLDAWS